MTTILLHPTAYRAATDEQLVDLVRSGDDRAFAAIHDRYQPRLVAYARQLLGGAHHDAEEVVQDAFFRGLGALRADTREMDLTQLARLQALIDREYPSVDTRQRELDRQARLQASIDLEIAERRAKKDAR